jgi:ABC-type branched-subunit amino acid transport system substrate-binding protein
LTRRGWLIALVAVVLVLAVACDSGVLQPQQARPEIAIATLGPLAQADVSATFEGVQFAIDRNPTLRGYRLRRAAFDDAVAGIYDPAKSLQSLKQLIADPAILGVMEPSISVEVGNSLPLINRMGLALVSPATADCLTLALPACRLPPAPHAAGQSSFFRVATPDRMQPLAMAEYAEENLGLRRAAVVTDKSDYGNLLVEGFSQRFAALGGKVVWRDTFATNDSDFAPLLHRIRESSPEAIYVGGTSLDYTCRMRAQMKAIFATDLYFLGADGIMDDHCLQDAADNLDERMIATTPAPQKRATPEATTVVNAYRKAHPQSPSGGTYTFAGYDCSMILIDAMGRAIDANGGRIPNRAQVRQAVAQTKGLKGVTGIWSFDENGDPANPTVALYQVKQDRWSPLTNVTVKG